MTITDDDTLIFESIEFEIPCDAAGAELWPDTPGPARWAALHVCPGCEYSHLFLLCDDCKEFIFKYRRHNSCNYCGHVEKTLSAFFASVNPI